MTKRIILFVLGMAFAISLLAPTVSAQTGTVTPTATAPTTEPTTAPETPTTEPAVTASATAAASATSTPIAMTDDGLRPEDVTFNPYDLAKVVEGVVVPAVPYDNSEPPGPVGAPSHVAYTFDGTERLWVIPSEAYQAQWNAAGNDSISQTVEQLQLLLRDKPASPKLPLPFLPPVPATNDVAGRVRYLDFDGGSGIAYLGRWAQDASPVLASQIFYSFVGLTNDGKYIVSFQFPASTSFLPDDVSELLPEHLAYIEANPKTYLQQTNSLLDVLRNSAFGPDLSRLDGLVFSISVPSTGNPLPTPAGALPTPDSSSTVPAPTDGGAATPVPTAGGASADFRRLLAADWKWLQSTGAETLTVEDPSLYTIRFNNANGFGITADCNIGAGNYTVSGNLLTIKDIQSTLVFCGEESLDQKFTELLLQAASYSFQGPNLLIQLKNNGGTLRFGP